MLLAPGLEAQTRPALTEHGSNAAADELKLRFEKQRAAEQAGDPAAVVESSQRLAALALRELAYIRLLEGAFPMSVKLYEQSLTMENNPDTHVDLAIAYMRERRAPEAVAEAEKAVIVYPKSARALHVKGKACMMVPDYKCAVEALQRSLQIDGDMDAAYALGVSELALKEKDKAAAVFAQMIQIGGDHAMFHVRFGRAYRDAGYNDDAIREFKRAIAMEPTKNHAHYFLGVVYMMRNEWGANPEALHEFQEAVRVDPQDFFGNYFLGILESTYRQFPESNAHLRVAQRAMPNWPEAYLYLGLNAFEQHDYSEAETNLKKAIELTGTDTQRNNFQIRRAYLALGRILIETHRKEEGEKALQRAREVSNQALAATQQQVAGMGNGAGVVPLAPPDPEPAPLTNETVDPTAQLDASVLARADLTDAELKQAEAREKELRAILGSTFNDWGTAEARQQQYGEALIHFHEAERWAPETPGLMRNIGVAAFRVEGYSEAVRALTAAVQSDPHDQRSRSMLAMSQVTLEHYGDAAAQFKELGNAVFSDPRLAYAYAYALSRSNQPQEAGVVLDKLTAQQLAPDMLVLAGQVYADTGNYEHAVTCFRTAAQENPSLPQAHYLAGAALIRLDRPAEAIPELQAELKLAPANTDAQFNLAYALLQTSQKEQAETLLRSLIAAHPDHAQAQYELGKELLDAGNTAEAIQHLEIAARADPDRDYIHYQLQSAYRRAGRTSDADRELQLYRETKARNRERTLPHMEQHAATAAAPAANRPQ